MFSILIFLKYYWIVHSAAQQPIVNSTQHDIGDTFNIICDVTRFADLKKISDFDYLEELSLHRKSFVTLTSIPLVIYLPSTDFSFIDGVVKSNFLVKHNPRNQWLFQRTGGVAFTNRKTNQKNIKIIVTAVNFQCSDAGEYHCKITLSSGKLFSTSPVNITAKAPISDHKIQINLHNGNDSYSSTNYVEESIILTCTVTGPPSLLITWNQTAKGSTKENPATGKISSNSTSQSVVSTGCEIHYYFLKLHFELQETDDGNTYYCIVSNDTGEQSRENFTLRIISFIKSTSQPESQSASTGVGTYFVGVLLFFASATVLIYYFGIRKKHRSSRDDKHESEA